MFFFLALASMVGYSIQSLLMASCYRTMDRLSAVAYRGLAIGICMAPLLALVPKDHFERGLDCLPSILLGAFMTAVANFFGARSYAFLPVGIATALSVCFGAICTCVLSFALLDERLSGLQIVCLLLLFIGTLALGSTEARGELPLEYSPSRGLTNSILFGIFISWGYFFVGSLSRELHPFLVGYSWELLIGVFAANFAIVRGFLGSFGLETYDSKKFFKILLFSSPTVVGTGCYALAAVRGPIGLLTSVLASSMVFNSILGHALYRESLSKLQWVLLSLVCLAVIALKYCS